MWTAIADQVCCSGGGGGGNVPIISIIYCRLNLIDTITQLDIFMMLLLEFLGRIIIINVINLLIQSLKITLFCVYRKTSNFIKHGCQNSIAMW